MSKGLGFCKTCKEFFSCKWRGQRYCCWTCYALRNQKNCQVVAKSVRIFLAFPLKPRIPPEFNVDQSDS